MLLHSQISQIKLVWTVIVTMQVGHDTWAQVVERVGLCSEGRQVDPRPASCVMVVVSLGFTLLALCLEKKKPYKSNPVLLSCRGAGHTWLIYWMCHVVMVHLINLSWLFFLLSSSLSFSPRHISPLVFHIIWMSSLITSDPVMSLSVVIRKEQLIFSLHL